MPSTVAQMLLERKKQIDEMKELFGDEYLDYDLVFCHSSGRPMEGQVINRALKKLIQDNDLPDVLHCMSGNTTKVKNIKKYLLAALFNAPSTMNGYYQAEVNHDMPGLVR